METLTLNTFKSQINKYLDLVKAGKSISFERGTDMFTVIPTKTEAAKKEEFTITPELQATMEEVRREYKEGKCTVCRTKEEIISHLRAL